MMNLGLVSSTRNSITNGDHIVSSQKDIWYFICGGSVMMYHYFSVQQFPHTLIYTTFHCMMPRDILHECHWKHASPTQAWNNASLDYLYVYSLSNALNKGLQLALVNIMLNWCKSVSCRVSVMISLVSPSDIPQGYVFGPLVFSSESTSQFLLLCLLPSLCPEGLLDTAVSCLNSLLWQAASRSQGPSKYFSGLLQGWMWLPWWLAGDYPSDSREGGRVPHQSLTCTCLIMQNPQMSYKKLSCSSGKCYTRRVNLWLPAIPVPCQRSVIAVCALSAVVKPC